MEFRGVVLVAVVCCCGVLSRAPDTIYTSNADLQSLLLTNNELVKLLQVYVSREERRLEKVKRLTISELFANASEALTVPC
jgi:hypothetical protein